MKKATIFNAVKTIINNVIDSENSTLEDLRIAIENKSIESSDLYKTECYLYAQKAVKPSTYNDTLCRAYSYTYEDLVMVITVQLMDKFNYLLNKFYDLHTQFNDEQIIIAKFSAIVASIPGSKLADMYRHISKEQDYETTDSEGKKEIKRGKGLKATTVSLDHNNADDNDENLSLENNLASPEPTAEERIISRANILSMVRCLFDSPIELMTFMAKHSGISSTAMVDMLETSSVTDVFSEIAYSFATEYDIPEIIDTVSLFTEEQLTYSGSMSLKKVYDNARSTSNAKVKNYIKEHDNNK